LRSSDTAEHVQLDPATQIQVLDSMPDLAGASKEQRGAFIRDERVLVVWTDDLDHIVPLCKEFEQKLIKLVWHSRPVSRTPMFSQAGSVIGSSAVLNEKIAEVDEDAEQAKVDALEVLAKEAPRAQKPEKKSFFGFGKKVKAAPAQDLEKSSGPEARNVRLFSPIYSGLAAAFSLCKLHSPSSARTGR
jgi:hypothetical protein